MNQSHLTSVFILPIVVIACSGNNSKGDSSRSGGASSAGGASTAGGTTVQGLGGTSSAGGASTAGGTTVHSFGGVGNGGASVQGGSATRTSTGGIGWGGISSVSSSQGGSSLGSTTNTATGGWIENFDSATSKYINFVPQGTSSAKSNVADSASSDGRALQLTLSSNVQPTPTYGAQVESKNAYQYGSFSARLRTAACTNQPNTGVVTGLFTYFNDGADHNGDGLPDNSEIDFEWLCAAPEVVYLTMWTDYRDSDSAQKRVSRSINLRTGAIAYTSYFQQFDNGQTLTGTETQPSQLAALANYDSSLNDYEYGFDWASDHVTWWIRHPTTGAAVVLWDYRGNSARIPTLAATYMANVWHTPDWSPDGKPNAISSPTAAVTAWVDFMRYQPL